MNKNRILAIVIRHLYIWPRSLERWMGSLGWPLLDLLLWGLASSYFQKRFQDSFSLLPAILGAVILWTIVYRVQQDISVNFLDEAWNKNLINIFSTPLKVEEFLLAMIILGLVKLSLTFLSLTVGAFLLYQFNIFSSFGLLLPILFLNLLLLGWSFGFLIDGLILRFGYDVEDFAWSLVALISPFSCVFYPLSSLPFWAQKVALLLPSTYVFEEARRLLLEERIIGENLLISFLLSIFYLFLSLKFFKLMYEEARKWGRLVKLN